MNSKDIPTYFEDGHQNTTFDLIPENRQKELEGAIVLTDNNNKKQMCITKNGDGYLLGADTLENKGFLINSWDLQWANFEVTENGNYKITSGSISAPFYKGGKTHRKKLNKRNRAIKLTRRRRSNKK